jgi:hypothetical protein
MCLILFTLDAWDKVSTMFIICFGFWGFQTTASLNSSDWLLLQSVPTSISILHHTLSEVCHPLLTLCCKGIFTRNCWLQNEEYITLYTTCHTYMAHTSVTGRVNYYAAAVSCEASFSIAAGNLPGCP